ncbi:MAG: hypothetical protein I8H71_12560 [Xanthomonadaceae bacterium]|nr:hypothetical protein [Xanthomonadaceae bacterium]
MSRLTGPPADVPTLTEIVHPVVAGGAASGGAVGVAPASAEMQELMVRRVLQRIDLVLERRLHEAIEQLILEHADGLLPRLREEIELVVRESVSQAFGQESEAFAARPQSRQQDVP